MKRKTLEQKEKKYLIERYYKNEKLLEYVVCENYDFTSNTYENGLRFKKLTDAYFYYNYLVNHYTHFLRIIKHHEELEKRKIENKVQKKVEKN